MRLHSMWGWKRRKKIEEGRMDQDSIPLLEREAYTQTSLNSDS